MDYCYVVFVKTGNEEYVRQSLIDRLNAEHFTPFVPKKMMVFKRQGLFSKVHRICFPGYVFILSAFAPIDFMRAIFPVLYPINEAYKILHYGDDRCDIALRENERRSLLSLFGDKFIIDCLVGVMEGDRVQIVSGSMLGTEGTVKKVILRKREVVIEIPFLGDIRPVTLGLDIIEKV